MQIPEESCNNIDVHDSHTWLRSTPFTHHLVTCLGVQAKDEPVVPAVRPVAPTWKYREHEQCLDSHFHLPHTWGSEDQHGVRYCWGLTTQPILANDDSGLRMRPGDQPLPTKNDSASIQSKVREDINKREQVGIQRYGTPLQPFNGRSSVQDLYDELLDGACYARQWIEEKHIMAEAVGNVLDSLVWLSTPHKSDPPLTKNDVIRQLEVLKEWLSR